MRFAFDVLTVSVILVVTSSVGAGTKAPPPRQAHQQQEVVLSDNQSAILRVAIASGDSVEIKVTTTEYEADTYPYVTTYDRYVWTGWGSQYSPPRRLISSLSVTVGGRGVWVPLSAFSDLANARRLQFEETTTADETWATFRITLSGGEKAATYAAVLEFNTLALERRSVWASSFPMREREVTVYTMATIRPRSR
ncbi:hypothetical protein ACFL4Y_03740 [Gemmatimonadota bacterium]